MAVGGGEQHKSSLCQSLRPHRADNPACPPHPLSSHNMTVLLYIDVHNT